MIKLTPTYSEILVSSLSRTEVTRRMGLVTDQVNFMDASVIKKNQISFFNGYIQGSRFQLSLKINKADSFLPLIKGEIEPTEKGCIIFLDYSFFPSTEFFLGFWGVITFLLTLFFLIFMQDWLFASLSVLVGTGNYFFAFFYFKRKVKQSQRVFYEMMDIKVRE
ncbi:hypothetical protein [Negadavirga shengliensis]|uniref:Uncharacterized protein n=1 Tax=Negadavirga shengliensis TaxID=1389218 RepID=A0ABV9SYC5_9BACT